MAEEKPNYRKILEDILRDPKGTTGFATISKKLRDLVQLALRSGDEDQIRQLVETKFDYVLRGEKPEAASEPEPKKPATSETKAEPKAADPTDEPESIKKLAGRGVRPTPGRPRIRTRPARELDAPAEPKKPAETKPSDEAPKGKPTPPPAPTATPKGGPTRTRPARELTKREGGLSPTDLRSPEEPTPTPAAPTPTAPAPTPKPSRRDSPTFKRRMDRLRAAAGAKTKGTLGLMALGGLAGVGLRLLTKKAPPDLSQIREEETISRQRSASARIAQLLEQARMERTLAQNQARLAQANPTLYTSVMAGRKVPTGAVVLGGRPRTDLMRELAASMDSGAFQKRDPLSDLMG